MRRTKNNWMKTISLILKSLRCRSAPLLLLCCTAVAPLSLRCRSAVIPLSFCCCHSCCCYAVAPAIASAVTPLSLRCCSIITQMSLRFHSADASVAPLPLLSLLLSLHFHSCCCSGVALVSLWCRSANVWLSVRRRSIVALLPLFPLLLSLQLSLLLSLHCCRLDG